MLECNDHVRPYCRRKLILQVYADILFGSFQEKTWPLNQDLSIRGQPFNHMKSTDFVD